MPDDGFDEDQGNCKISNRCTEASQTEENKTARWQPGTNAVAYASSKE
jgi:hypothetical protein